MPGQILSLSITAALLLCATPARAWNDRGHMVIAALAYEQLDATVKARVDTLLRLNPQYGSWTNGVSKSLAREVAFVRAATWPDFIKAKTSGYTDDGAQPSGPESSQNIGYADKLQHRYWHYVDLPFSSDGTPVEDPVAPNAETQIEAFRAALSSANVSDDVKGYDLVWLLHLVGDVHQPLHATSRFSAALPHGDEGGNKVKVTGSAKNLHAYWDGALGVGGSASAAIQAARKLANGGLPSGDGSTQDWLHESLKAAQTHVYTKPVGAGTGPYTLTASYQNAAATVANERARLAGARLARILNAALGAVASGS